MTAPAHLRGHMPKSTEWQLRAERHRHIVACLRAGLTYRETAAHLGISAPRACKIAKQPEPTNPHTGESL